MISATGLSLGNWVDFAGKYYKIHTLSKNVLQLSGDFIGGSVFKIKDVSAIPLTSEILVSSHAVKNIAGDGENKVTYYDVGKLTICDWGNGFEMSNPFARGLRVKLESVHQFQNLYFAITGEDWKIIFPSETSIN